jgi:hypothetical protein
MERTFVDRTGKVFVDKSLNHTAITIDGKRADVCPVIVLNSGEIRSECFAPEPVELLVPQVPPVRPNGPPSDGRIIPIEGYERDPYGISTRRKLRGPKEEIVQVEIEPILKEDPSFSFTDASLASQSQIGWDEEDDLQEGLQALDPLSEEYLEALNKDVEDNGDQGVEGFDALLEPVAAPPAWVQEALDALEADGQQESITLTVSGDMNIQANKLEGQVVEGQRNLAEELREGFQALERSRPVVDEPQLPNASTLLGEMQQTFAERGRVYGSSYVRAGKVLKALIPDGVVVETESDYAIMATLGIIVHKLCRALNPKGLSPVRISQLDHQDSIHDAAVYAAIWEELVIRDKASR